MKYIGIKFTCFNIFRYVLFQHKLSICDCTKKYKRISCTTDDKKITKSSLSTFLIFVMNRGDRNHTILLNDAFTTLSLRT